MANAANAQTALKYPFNYKWGNTVVPVTCEIDTFDTNLTIYAAQTGKIISVVGINLVTPIGCNVRLKSGSSNTRVVIPLAANSGQWKGVSDEILFSTQPGEALVTEITDEESAAALIVEFYLAISGAVN